MPLSSPVAVKVAGEGTWAAPMEIQPRTTGNPDGVAGTLASARAGTVKLPAAGLARHWNPPETLFAGSTLNPMMEMTLALAGALDHVTRSEEHTSELQSLRHLVCRLLLE